MDDLLTLQRIVANLRDEAEKQKNDVDDNCRFYINDDKYKFYRQVFAKFEAEECAYDNVVNIIDNMLELYLNALNDHFDVLENDNEDFDTE